MVFGLALCPKCHQQAQKISGHLFCRNCGVRLCPRCSAVVPFSSNYCRECAFYCGTVQSGVSPHDDRSDVQSEYVCPNCESRVTAAHKNCPVCGYLGARNFAKHTSSGTTGVGTTSAESLLSAKRYPERQPTGPPSEPTRGEVTTHATGAWSAGMVAGDSQSQAMPFPSEPANQRASQPPMPPLRSPFLKELAGTESREWRLPPLRRFLKPALASLLLIVVTVFVSAVAGGALSLNLGQRFDNVPSPALPVLNSTPIQTYNIYSNVTPDGAGSVQISPMSETYEPDTEVTLEVTAASGYEFDYWDGGISGSSTTLLLVMDSDKNVTAHFKVKDTIPPVIAGVAVSEITDISAIVSCETDEHTSAQVEYWMPDGDHKITKSDDDLKTRHVVRLTGLKPSTTYHLTVRSIDESGNQASSHEETLKTLRAIRVGHEVGNRAPEIALSKYEDDNPKSPNDGSPVVLSDFRDKKVLLNFWSTYCGACIMEFPFFRAIYEDKEWAGRNSGDSDLAVITVCIDGRADRIKILEEKYFDDYGSYTFPILLDEEASTKDSYHVWKLPKTVFIDSDGIIRETKLGRFTSQEEIEDILNSL